MAGELIARGRSADIFDAGDGRVLRRNRTWAVPRHEPAVMRAVRAAGYPVPEVFSVDDREMLLERVTGVDLLKQIEKTPWRARRFGALLADLHRRLAAIAVDPAVVQSGDVAMIGDHVPPAYVHGDLHPGNVMLTATGPVVIDWEGARLGPPDADVAITWLLLDVADLDDVPWFLRPIVGLVRGSLRKAFLAGVDRPSAETVRLVCQIRLGDRNLKPAELERVAQFQATHG